MNSTIVTQLCKQAAQLKDQLTRTEKALEALTGRGGQAWKPASTTARVGRKRKMSAAARAKIGAAQRKRWKKWKAAKK